ncbi:hypothetical protein SAMN05443287_103137 [Micromonospora phaseoli]|uniref:ATP synthase protein I n=1 Tax=Micromonospora phaseoli TaxID=1144548 RepID=A0A1H6WHI6_9ACTN|nr:hypothetical protein [Micromonospora phaseoli]PZW01770.1 hypothetical protein CLV64_102136 [Micromonospora phaseoli]GIJ78154.1 hypothetical protein Xph01_25860 [Micromonospora phaseoli]SEJ15176.1 hypothetical protein SAMN05443287_103137 [Micromonospora phaseoli]
MSAPRAGEPGVPATDVPRAGEPGAIRARLPYLRLPLLACAALAVVGVPAAAVLRGPTGAAGVAAGIALVVVSYLISGLSVAWADAVHPKLIMSVGLVTYVTKIVILGVVMAAVAATGWPGLPDLGVAIIAAVVVWTGAHLTWALRSPLPTVDRSSDH